MKRYSAIFVAVINLSPVPGYPADEERPMTPSRLEQRSQSFMITLNAPVTEATPFFGPIREAEWAPAWKPQFLHPVGGTQRAGVVFTTKGANGSERIWLLTRYDVDEGEVDYVAITPGFIANEIMIRVVPDSERHCRATITYRRSALTPGANAEVARLDSRWAEEQRRQWEMSINRVLAKGGGHD